MHQCSTALDGRSDVHRLGHLFQVGAFGERIVAVCIDAVRALHRVRHSQRNERLLALRQRTLGEHGAVPIEEFLPQGRRILGYVSELLEVRSVVIVVVMVYHQAGLACCTSMLHVPPCKRANVRYHHGMWSWLLFAGMRCAAFGAAFEDVVEEATGKGDVPGARVSFVVDAPPDDVLALLWDAARFRKVFPDVKQVDVQQRHSDNDIEVSFVVDAVVTNVSYRLRRVRTLHAGGGGDVKWHQTSGDLSSIDGSWRVRLHGTHGSKVVYESYVDPGGPGFVKSTYRDVALRKLRELPKHVRGAVPATACPSEG
jgi:carbon monoxide dehydrogenase subunit G